MLLPQPFKDRYSQLVDDPETFFSILEVLLPKSFRVNTLKSTSEEVKESFERYGIGLKQMDWYPDAFVSELPDIGSTLEHFSGAIYFQELVSMLPPLLVRKELETTKRVLDGCAAPGSKTTQLAALMDNKGTITANDLSYSRIRALKFNIEKTGTLNTVITNRDLLSFPQMEFGVIILDVPCSAEGTIRKNAELFDCWSIAEVEKHSKLQKKLIIKAFDMLSPGGTMVYSTCTFAPEENEMVVEHLLKNRPAQVEPIEIPGFKTSKPVTEWAGQEFDSQVSKTLRIWPHHNDSGGFFLAKVTK